MGLRCGLLAVGSAALQIIGLALVAWDLWRVQRRTFGVPVWMQRLEGRVRRLLGLRRDVTLHAQSANAIASAGSARLRVRRNPGDTLEERITALEANLAALDTASEERFTDMEQRLTAAHQRADEAHAHAEQLRRQHEHERREDLRRTMPVQWIGTGLFAIGALLSMWGALSC